MLVCYNAGSLAITDTYTGTVIL